MNLTCKLHLPQFQGRIFPRQTTQLPIALYTPVFKSWLTLKVSSDNHVWYKAADICGISWRVMEVQFDWSLFRCFPLCKCCLVHKLVKNCLCKNLNEKFDLSLLNAQVRMTENVVLLSLLSQWLYQGLKQCFSLPQETLEKIDTVYICLWKCRADFQRCPDVFELLKSKPPDINFE